MSETKRYAMVRGLSVTPELVASYLPSNYKVIGTGRDEVWEGHFEDVVLIEGRDDHGWTLDRYVAPRLGSGMMRCDEIDLSHKLMKEVAA